MNLLFVTGTDTDVGKTVISAGLARALSDRGINVGVMKPFAAAELESESDFKSEDTQILAKAARVSDGDELLNPQFFPMPASPYTASKTLGVKVDVKLVLEKFQELKKLHDVIIIEGMGGVMTPILQDYFIADLIQDMKADAIIVIRSKIGTINHTVLTSNACKDHKINVRGIIINDFDSEGYPTDELARDIQNLTSHKVLGVLPKFDTLDAATVSRAISENLNLEDLVNS